MKHRDPWMFAVVISVFILVSSGCLGGDQNRTSDSTDSPTTNTHLIVPTTVSFRASLKVFENNKILENYSYTGRITYPSKNAVVSIDIAYSPQDEQIAGNWRHKKIVIENGTSVRIFEVPPASWTYVPKNESEQIMDEVFNKNPYRVLVEILQNKGNVPDNGNFSIEIPSDKCHYLLAPIIGGDALPDVTLRGWVVIHNGNLKSAHLEGVSGSKKYVFDMEVFE